MFMCAVNFTWKTDHFYTDMLKDLVLLVLVSKLEMHKLVIAMLSTGICPEIQIEFIKKVCHGSKANNLCKNQSLLV